MVIFNSRHNAFRHFGNSDTKGTPQRNIFVSSCLLLESVFYTCFQCFACDVKQGLHRSEQTLSQLLPTHHEPT